MNLEMNLKYFQIQKWMLQADRVEKVDEKNGVIWVVFMFPSWVMILKLSEKVHFSNFVLTLAKKSKYVKTIDIYASETSRYAVSEKVIVYYAMTSCFEDISVWNRRALLNFCWVSIVFDILIANISWMVAQVPINHIIFWKTVTKTFKSIYINCFNRLRFLAEVSTKLQKMHFFGQFKDYNSGRKHGNKTNDHIFSFIFSALLFQNQSPIFYCPLFSENYLNTQARINKIVNKHTSDYHPSPSQSISRIHTLIFLWTPKGFISPESFLNFFLNLYISPWLRKSFKFSVKITANTFVSQKIESVHFYSYPQAKLYCKFLSLSSRQKRIAHSSRTVFFEDIFSWEERGERNMELKKIPKLTKVLVTSLDKFHNLCNLYIFGLCFVVQ